MRTAHGRRTILCLLVIVLMASSEASSTASPSTAPLEKGIHEEGVLLVKFKEGVTRVDERVRSVLAEPQQIFVRRGTSETVSRFDPDVARNPSRYEERTQRLGLKKVTRLFPPVRISEQAREEFRRRGITAPEAIFNNSTLDRWYRIELHEKTADLVDLGLRFKARADVEHVSDNWIGRLNATNPDDYHYVHTGDLTNPAYENQWPIDVLHLPQAWDHTTGSASVVVAVVDSGLYYEHPDIQGTPGQTKVWINWKEDVNATPTTQGKECADYWPYDEAGNDCYDRYTFGGDENLLDDDGNGYIDDINGFSFWESKDIAPIGGKPVNGPLGPDDTIAHGTRMAGIIGAVTNNSTGMAGVCWGCRIMPVAVFSDQSYSYATQVDLVAQGIRYAASNGARVINLSLGFYDGAHSTTGDVFDVGRREILHDAVIEAYEVGVLLVASAGNDNKAIGEQDSAGNYPAGSFFPAAFPEVLTVGATMPPNGTVRWVDPDLQGGSNYGPKLDLVAPGARMALSLRATDMNTGLPIAVAGIRNIGNDYNEGGGTSSATAFASGVAALTLSGNPALSLSQLTTILRDSATDLTSAYDEAGQIQVGLPVPNPYTGWGLLNARDAMDQALAAAPDFEISWWEAVALSSGEFQVSGRVENRGQTTAHDVILRVYDAETDEVLATHTIETLEANTPFVDLLTIVVRKSPLPRWIRIWVDPDNYFPEINEDNNKTEPPLFLLPYGTPVIGPLQPNSTHENQQLEFDVVASTAEDPVSFPPGEQTLPSPSATFPNIATTPTSATNRFKWTPATGQGSASGTKYTARFLARNADTPSLSATADNIITVYPPLSGPYVLPFVLQSFARSFQTGKSVSIGPLVSPEMLSNSRTPAGGDYDLRKFAIRLDDVLYYRIYYYSNGKWNAPVSVPRTPVHDNAYVTKSGSMYMFDVYPAPGIDDDPRDTWHGAEWIPLYACTQWNGVNTECLHAAWPYAASLRFVEQDPLGTNFGTAGYMGWNVRFGDWVQACTSNFDTSAFTNGLAVRFWSSGTTDASQLTSISVNMLDDSTNAIKPDYRIEIHLKSLNEPPAFASPIGPKTTQEKSTLQFTLPTATDINGDTIFTYSATGLPRGATFNPSNRVFTWEPDYDQAGTYTVNFNVSDGYEQSTVSVPITVAQFPLRFIPIGSKTLRTYMNTHLTIQLRLYDPYPAPGPITYTASPLPPTATFVGQTFEMLIPPEIANTSYDVTFRVTQGAQSWAETVHITILEGWDGGGGDPCEVGTCGDPQPKRPTF